MKYCTKKQCLSDLASQIMFEALSGGVGRAGAEKSPRCGLCNEAVSVAHQY